MKWKINVLGLNLFKSDEVNIMLFHIFLFNILLGFYLYCSFYPQRFLLEAIVKSTVVIASLISSLLNCINLNDDHERIQDVLVKFFFF